MNIMDHDVFAFIKPSLDAHTLGVNSVAELLNDCNYKVIVAEKSIEDAMNNFKYEVNKNLIFNWLKYQKVTRIGLSYRLDQDEAVKMVGQFVKELRDANMLAYQGGNIQSLYFAGLPSTCEIIKKEHNGLVTTFSGGETIRETLVKLGIPEYRIPTDIVEGSLYDDMRMEFGKDIIKSQAYNSYIPINRSNYKEFGTNKDTVIKRIDYNMKTTFAPLIRAHVGPFSSSVNRKESVNEFIKWSKTLANSGLLDILSIGSSQLTQSNFGEDWKEKPNGGGVPINSPEEYRQIWEASRPMLVRTYAGTTNIPKLAKMHEETINISWHALSLWWFNQLDERGPYDLYTNLQQHIETIKFIAQSGKPFEPNVPHHFAFRGADDVTYVVSAYLSAKLAKKYGVNTLILQNMLNTPRLTWGIQDLAKSRAMLKLVKSLEDPNFRVLLQPRAGLDYFKPDLEEAKIQLSAVTALMDDIDPHQEQSPEIIHVVSYSEASHLATPDVINESIKITQYSLEKYRELRRMGKIEDMSKNLDVEERMMWLLEQAKTVISNIEKHIKNPYSAEGFYTIFAAGFLPVPYLWGEVGEFKYAKTWKTKPIKGSIKVIDHNNLPVTSDRVVTAALNRLEEVERTLNAKKILIK
jgi:hypothetical protein